MKISAFMKYGELAASTRERLMPYEPDLAAAGFQIGYRAPQERSFQANSQQAASLGDRNGRGLA
jgi:hypothetical protein